MTILGTRALPATVTRATSSQLVEATRTLTTESVNLEPKPTTPATLKWAVARTVARTAVKTALYGALGYYAGSQAGLLPGAATLVLASQMFAPGFGVGALGSALGASKAGLNANWLTALGMVGGTLAGLAALGGGLYLGFTPDHGTALAVAGGVAGLIRGLTGAVAKELDNPAVSASVEEYSKAWDRYQMRQAEVEASQRSASQREEQARIQPGAIQDLGGSLLIGTIRLAKRAQPNRMS